MARLYTAKSEMLATAPLPLGYGAYTFVLGVDACFLLGAWLWAASIHPLPKTYLSEIIFPVELLARALASTMLATLSFLGFWVFMWLPDEPWALRAAFLAESMTWAMSTWLIWMEHRRSLTTSTLLRFFWVFRWALMTKSLYSAIMSMTSWWDEVAHAKLALHCVVYGSFTCLAVSSFWAQRDLTNLSPEVLALSRQRLKSIASIHAHGKQWVQQMYGSLDQYLPHRPRTPVHESVLFPTPTDRVRVSIPSYTITRMSSSSFVSYKILVTTEDETWSVRRRFSDFVFLRDELPECVKLGPLFPEKTLLKQFNPKRIDARRVKLERYLNAVLSHPHFDVQNSLAVCDFLEMVRWRHLV
ncbi:hypothetical protein, variant [Saprolegnia diclina VS20]|uniref:PX domain-containing protein n=1 Tax=Saprolegnia diclina (strain VS20) TaxID=1156394 RepID=T0PXE9_SAPDV|nr:hypothetical protein, variant [Saprolegnia diclina VS20]EQC30209.1 hypothetical protein, variant [Saprolegnia diclina VS20]|eukprot:XP_008616341.1 hypothetical protein, variant [Saprolegnia diclina VS20]